MAGYGELVLVCGDMHIPHRCADVAEQFRTILVPNKMQHVLCTGNLVTRDTLDYLRSLAPRVHAVKGDFDEDDSLPDTKVVTIGSFRIGLVHGHQVAPAGEVESLAALQRSLDVDVLVSGHTHKTSISEYDGRCFVNPGSLTGAFTPLLALDDSGLSLPKSPNPSFLLMNISGEKIDFFVYELSQETGKLKISKSSFTKPSATAGAAGGAGGKA